MFKTFLKNYKAKLNFKKREKKRKSGTQNIPYKDSYLSPIQLNLQCIKFK